MSIELITLISRYQGLSTDTKPIEGVWRGSEFFEEDTGYIYKFTGTSWISPAIKILVNDGDNNPISSQDGALNIHDSHVHDNLINHFVFSKTGQPTTTLDGPVAVGDRVISLVSAAGFAVGGHVDMKQGTAHIHHWRQIVAINGNDITIDAPADVNFASGSSAEGGIANMNVDGSVTPVIFRITPKGTQSIHIVKILTTIESESAADDSKFGGITAITNGVVLRTNRNNGEYYETLSVWQSNKDMKEDMFDVIYSDKAGGGNYGVAGEWLLAESGAIVNISEPNNDFFEVVIQDDLTSLIDFQIKVQGHPEGA